MRTAQAVQTTLLSITDATAHVTLKDGPPDVAVQACPTFNLSADQCMTQRFDATGVVTFDLPESGRGSPWVYRVPAPTEPHPELRTFLYVYATPTIGAQSRTLLRGPASLTSGVPHDRTLGTVLALTADCVGSFSITTTQPTGVEFELSPAGARGPFYGFTPSPGGATDGYSAWFFDVRSEIATVSAYHRGSGTRDRIDSIAVPVEPGATTIILFFLPAVFQ